jgi:predicted alpha/beta-fold hydrolase
MSDSWSYRAPRWLPGGHLQTIWAALAARPHDAIDPLWRRERWATPDGDFVDADWQDAAPAAAPVIALFHGLEGSSSSHYAKALAAAARERDWHLVVPHFRGCSGELNLAPRAYHSGDFEEVGWMLERVRAVHSGPIVAVGVSLGGNALLRWVEECGDQAGPSVRAVASVCAPLDLAAGGSALGCGLNRRIYTPMFLRTLKPKALAKLAQHPGLFDRQRMLRARDLYEFDNVVTAPLHGFRDTDDYWSRASAKPHLHRIRIPALVLNARNDPFVPAASLPTADEVGRYVTLWQPRECGHVGFADGAFPGHVQGLPAALLRWLALHM